MTDLDGVPIELDGELGDLAPFEVLDDLADRARFAFLVEMDHCIAERHPFRLLCARYLASRGWTWFGEECDWRWGERVDRYLRTGDEAELTHDDDGRWYTSGLLATTTDGAPHEAMRAADREAAAALRRTLPAVRWFGFDSGGSDEEYLRRANAIRSIDEAVDFMAYREQLMHERIGHVAHAHPDAKIALLAGGPHLAKDDATLHAPGLLSWAGRAASTGHHVTHELAAGAPVLAIWLLHGGGTTSSPYLPGGDLSVPEGTVNACLRGRWDRPCLVRVAEDDQVRVFAGMNNVTMTCRPSEQVDALVFCPEVTPV